MKSENGKAMGVELLAAAMGALAVALANKETREKIQDKVNDLLGKGKEKIEETKSELEQRLDEDNHCC
ncbi:MAG: YtxH domain-containing protein [Patescibacteria group bacterium]|nr:YtxH domain-containing protein [Patescibacteria group bacterium]